MPPYPIGVCAHCEQPNRMLKYARRTMCWHYACQRAAHTEVQARKERLGGGVAKKQKVAPVFCMKVLEIHGQRDIDPAVLISAARRNKLGKSEMNVSYLVYGELGEMQQDKGFSGIRWVELTDLLNLGKSALTAMSKYETKLRERMQEQRAALEKAGEEVQE